MQDDLISLVAAQRGHYRLESSLHGDVWLELDRLFLHPVRLRPIVAELSTRLPAHNIDAVCGPLTGGAFLAQWVAAELDVEFGFAERIAGPKVNYQIPNGMRARLRGRRVAVIDDAIYAGSAVRGTVTDLKACEANLVAVGALLVLGDSAARYAQSEALPLEYLVRVEAGLWEPAGCPLCSGGVPLDDPFAPTGESN